MLDFPDITEQITRLLEQAANMNADLEDYVAFLQELDDEVSSRLAAATDDLHNR